MSYGLKKYTHQLNQEVLDANFSVNRTLVLIHVI